MNPSATTTCGRIRGRLIESNGRSLIAFRGVPFAAPPIGDARFAPPSPAKPWSGERDAVEFGPSPPQAGGALLDLLAVAATGSQSEDCLTLNVTTPALDRGRRPVMVWIHGGAFLSGTSAVPVHDGAPLAARGDVVVVTFNYRVGALGFAHLDGSDGGAPATNLGLLDQIAALRWIRDNAEALGGDPDRILVFGESAGAGSLCALLAAPAAHGLFQRGVIQSSAPDGFLEPEEASERTDRLREVLGGSLREAPVEALIEAQQAYAREKMWRTGMFFTPVVDGEILAERPMAAVRDGRASAVSLIVGTTRDELQLYKYGSPSPELDVPTIAQVLAPEIPGEVDGVPLARVVTDAYGAAREARGESTAGIDLVYAIQTDLAMRGPAIRLAEHHARQAGGIWMYLFDLESPCEGGALGACHALDVPFVLGTLDVPGLSAFTGAEPAVARISQEMMDAWIAFAKTGRPGTDSLDWPAYDLEARATLRFGEDTRVESAPREEERRALEGTVARATP